MYFHHFATWIHLHSVLLSSIILHKSGKAGHTGFILFFKCLSLSAKDLYFGGFFLKFLFGCFRESKVPFCNRLFLLFS